MGALARLLEERASGAVALVDAASGARWTWADLLAEARRREGWLAAAGVRAGDRAGLLVDRSPGFLAWLFALWRAGAVAVPLDVQSPPGEVQGLAGHAALAWLVADREVHADGPGLVDAADGRLRRPPPRDLEPSPEGDALILYTSGSTGRPKGVRHTHASVAASITCLSARYFSQAPPRILGVLPLTHSHGIFTHGLSGLAHGGTLVLAPPLDLFSAGRLWDLARTEGADFFSAVPAHFRLLLHASDDRPPEGMRAFSASAPLPQDLREALRERFGLSLANNFGMTETAGWCLYSDPDAPEGTVGRPTGCRVRVEGGEMLLAGPQVTPGYWRDPERSAEALRDGWLHTGDAVSLDPDGRVRYLGRLKRVLQVGGVSVHPEDIEAALRRHPEVEDCAVVGHEDPVYGEQPRAFVVLRPGAAAGPADLERSLREVLAPYRCPRWIEVVDRLPRTPGGKTDLRDLERRPLQARRGM